LIELNDIGPDPEVTSTGKCKRYSAAYQVRMLAEADAAIGVGEMDARLGSGQSAFGRRASRFAHMVFVGDGDRK